MKTPDPRTPKPGDHHISVRSEINEELSPPDLALVLARAALELRIRAAKEAKKEGQSNDAA